MTYNEFIDRYKPIKNPYFDKSPYEGTMFLPDQISLIFPHAQVKKLWSIVTIMITIDIIENKNIEHLEIQPGYSSTAKGFFVTEEPFENMQIAVKLP